MKAILKRSKGALATMVLMSGVGNILALTGSLFMLQVYDRVLPSRSVPTLVALIAIVAFLYAVQMAIEAIRARMIARVGRRIDEDLASPAFRAAVSLPLTSQSAHQRLDPVRDIDTIRQFISSPGPAALLDLPWVPLYLVLCFMFHTWLGVLTLAGAAIVSVLAVWGDFRSRAGSLTVTETGAQRQAIVDGGRRNAEVLATMNLASRLETRFTDANSRYLDAQLNSLDRSSGINGLVRGLRMLLQSLVLALAALLAIRQEISAGTIIATSILASRALAPIDAAVAQWRLFVGARQAHSRLRQALAAAFRDGPSTRLPSPKQMIRMVDGVIALPGAPGPLVTNLNFAAYAGDGIGVIGPSGAGKTSLARILTGVWPLARGKVTLDGAPLAFYSAEERGKMIGYLPQDVDLFDGTIAENIARFDPDAPSEAVVRAGQMANVHEMILRLPQGYDTRIGIGGIKLSAGQRQRIGLARALFRDPFLVVLDEPYSNLDGEGDLALKTAIAAVRTRGGIVVLIAHRHSAVSSVNKILTIMDGRQVAFGQKEEVLSRLAAVNGAAPAGPGPVDAAQPAFRSETRVTSNVA